MQEVFLVSGDNKNAAEDALRKDDVVGRQSIIVKAAHALDMKEDGYFIIIDGSDEALKKAEELLKNIARKYEHKDVVMAKLKEQEEAAIEGLGDILG
ncbi:MAG: hypothetical protein HYY37_02515 [Candidatus Aenigmarchaeota archaeon]|nr:hypothetical protein [Candidatus Aenigmarchaeota archaeon]